MYDFKVLWWLPYLGGIVAGVIAFLIWGLLAAIIVAVVAFFVLAFLGTSDKELKKRAKNGDNDARAELDRINDENAKAKQIDLDKKIEKAESKLRGAIYAVRIAREKMEAVPYKSLEWYDLEKRYRSCVESVQYAEESVEKLKQKKTE